MNIKEVSDAQEKLAERIRHMESEIGDKTMYIDQLKKERYESRRIKITETMSFEVIDKDTVWIWHDNPNRQKTPPGLGLSGYTASCISINRDDIALLINKLIELFKID